MAERQSISLLGVRIDNVDAAAALAAIEGFIGSRTPRMVVTADASCVVLAQTDGELRRIVNSADLVTPDSIGVLWAAKRLGTPLRERVSGIDIVISLCERAALRGYRVFLLGAAPGVARAAADSLRCRCPGIVIAGTHHGFFSAEDTPGIVKAVRETKPDVLFVGMGIPRQEKWIHRHLRELEVPVAMGVGGSFDVISGCVRRAPEWVQRRGLEWAFRLVCNPRKITKVMMLPKFVAIVLFSRRREPLADDRGD